MKRPPVVWDHTFGPTRAYIMHGTIFDPSSKAFYPRCAGQTDEVCYETQEEAVEHCLKYVRGVLETKITALKTQLSKAIEALPEDVDDSKDPKIQGIRSRLKECRLALEEVEDYENGEGDEE